MRFRKVTGDGPKYWSILGEISRPYNVVALKMGDPVYVTEGELDAEVGTQIGLTTIGFPGAHLWKPVFARLFRFRRVFVLQDGDDAGEQFGETLCKDIPGAKPIDMGVGRDLNSIFLDHGADYLKEWIGYE